MARYVAGPIETDVTAAVTGRETIQTALSDLPLDLEGRLAVAPSHATFEQLARAKTPEAAEQFAEYVSHLTRGFDFVLVDTPPLAANQAVAAVTGAESVALVAPATQRGLDAIPTIRGRLLTQKAAAAVADVTLSPFAPPFTPCKTERRSQAS